MAEWSGGGDGQVPRCRLKRQGFESEKEKSPVPKTAMTTWRRLLPRSSAQLLHHRGFPSQPPDPASPTHPILKTPASSFMSASLLSPTFNQILLLHNLSRRSSPPNLTAYPATA